MPLMPRISRIAALTLAVASPALAQDDQLAKCEKPFGILAVNEPQEQYMRVFQRYQLGSPAALLRMMAQNSKCFVVVERGVAMQNIAQERALARSGEMQQDANMGGGQMKAADFVMTAAVQVSDNNAGGVGGAVGGLLGHKAFAAVGGGVKFKDAQTSILIADARTTVQIAAAEGKARKTNFAIGALGGGGGGGAALGGYTSTAEGKVIAASYLDNFNKIVENLKADADMMARADKFKAVGLSGADVKAGASYAEGDVLTPKIDNVKLLTEPRDGAHSASALKKGDELVFLGEEKDGYVKVQGSTAEGWVKKTLVSKR
ncbi:MAG TPA: SH3 domain-containing protein [Gemmatimonadaceae bacterium]|nr:SH3 domain-containing protein [Gemmatimonadaceae bacterium]